MSFAAGIRAMHGRTWVVLAAVVAAVLPNSFAYSVGIDGAAAGYALSKVAAEEFQKAKKKAVRIVLGNSGSSGGLRKLCRSEADFANASRPILNEEASACRKSGVEFIELPVAFDAITVVVNPRNTFVSSLSAEELKRIWEPAAQGKVVRWSQVSSRFPDAPLKLLAPDSRFESVGTFSEALLGRGVRPRGDTMASVDDNVLIQGVARDIYALSYVPHSTYLDNRSRVKAVPIATSAGAAAVSPSPETLASGGYALLGRPLFLYVNVKSLDNHEVREFAQFILANGGQLARTARYVPLTEATYKVGLEHLRNRSTGSAWGGVVPVGLTPAEVQKRQAAL